MNRTHFIIGALSLCFGVAIGSVFLLRNNDVPILESTPQSVLVEKALSISVSVSGARTDENGSVSREGAGIIVQSRGLILTSKHLIGKDFGYTVTLNDGTQLPAKLITTHPSLDLALLAMLSDTPLSFPVGKFVHTHVGIHQGDTVIAIGNTLGLYPGSVSRGIISGLNRTVSFGEISMNGLIQTSIPMMIGNSGGPLINTDGNIIGINTGIVGGNSQIGWALPLTQAEVNTFSQN